MKQISKKFGFAMVATLISILVLSACGNAKTGASKGDDIRLEVIAKGFQNDYWKAVRTGAEKAAKEEGVKMNFVGPKDESAISDQVEMLNDAINKNPSAVALAALDTNAELDDIEQAMSKNIPIIGFDSGVPNAPKGAIKATASTDNYKAGALAADKTFTAIKKKITAAKKGKPVRIGVLSQEVNSLSITARTSGFIDEMVKDIEKMDGVGKGKVQVTGHDKFANKVKPQNAIAIIEVRIPAEVTDSAGKTEAQALLNKKDLISIYGSNEFAAKSIINADSAIAGGRIGKNKVIAVGFDSGTLQIDAIKSGKFLGSITQNPIAIGYNTVKLAVKASKGEKVKDVDTGSKWYDKANIDSKEIAPLLYK